MTEGEERREADSPGSQPDAQDAPREVAQTSEGGPEPAPGEAVESDQPQTVTSPEPPEAEHDLDGRPLLIFLTEVAGGRKLLRATRDRVSQASSIVVVAPQNEPAAGQIVDTDELYDAARSRVDVTLALLQEFGIEAVGDVMDPDPALALDDAIRAFEPGEVLLSALPQVRTGLARKDLIEAARARYQPEVGIIHIPVRIEDDSIRWDVTHTLVVATQTVNSPDLVQRLGERAAERPQRYTIACPRSEQVSREQVCSDLAATLASLYRDEIDATGQPMSPDPFNAVQNAIEHYRIDEILISTLSGERSRWLEEDLIGRVREITEKPIEHVESGGSAQPAAAPVEQPARA
ncbi:MAG TPA: hypothetical protein VKA89_03770 [Solirubrobacterales bacterium]|nr:hypothetical protein [Solirubrobacterales bacterium]